MAINSLGYRAWQGKLAPPWASVVVIAQTGIRRAWQSRWLRRLLFLAWLPALWFGAGFFVYEKAVELPGEARRLAPFFETQVTSPELDHLFRQIESGDLEGARHGVWSWLLLTFFRHPQGVVMALVVGLIAPPLISQDIRSRAFLLYFSRPIGRFEYIVGKLATIWFYLAMISMSPALSLYCVGVLLSPDVEVVAVTWDLPMRIIFATMVLSVPTASLALSLSALTQESRIAGFAWFAILILGWVACGVLSAVQAMHQSPSGRMTAFDGESYWSLLSLYHMSGRVQSWVFGFHSFQDVMGSAFMLVLITVCSLVILTRQVASPMRA